MAEHIPEDDEAMSEEYQRHADLGIPYCDPCKDDGKQLPAAGFCVDCNDYLCTECYNIHTRARPLRSHVLQDQNSMPSHKSRKDSVLERCKAHKQESVKWYCDSHKEVFCDVCRQVDHRNCKQVKTITEMIRNLTSTEGLKRIKDRLSTLEISFRDNSSGITENAEAAGRYYEAAIEEITRNLSTIRSRDMELMRALELTCDTTIKTITSILAELETLTEKGEEEQLFLATVKAESQLQSFEERLTSVRDDNKITRYTYVQETPSDADRVIGRICEIQVKITPVKLDVINVKTSSDTSTCWITGMDRLSDNRIVLADWYNSKIKLVDMTSKTVISELELGLEPWDLTRIDDKRIAVTTYKNKKILIVSVSDTLTLHKTIDKREFIYCQGIICSNDTLVVSYHGPCQIEILDLEGRVKQPIENTNKVGTGRFDDIEYIAHSPDTNTLYLSDYSNNKVLSMTRDGKILSSFTHEHLKHPKGITVSGDGTLFVCSYDSNKIYEVSSDLSKGQIIFDEKDGISKPQSIMYNDKEHKLYVGSRNKDTIQVFRV